MLIHVILRYSVPDWALRCFWPPSSSAPSSPCIPNQSPPCICRFASQADSRVTWNEALATPPYRPIYFPIQAVLSITLQYLSRRSFVATASIAAPTSNIQHPGFSGVQPFQKSKLPTAATGRPDRRRPTTDAQHQLGACDISVRPSSSTQPHASQRIAPNCQPLPPTGANMSKVIRSVKNVTKGYSNVQIKVREGGSGRLLAGHALLRRAAAGAHGLCG